MTKTGTNEQIARFICQAQLSSEAGKGFQSIFTRHKLPGKLNYLMKDRYIRNAVNKIRNEDSDFTYWIELRPDQTGRDSILVFFDFSIDNKPFQVSFHIPLTKINSKCAYELYNLRNTGTKTKWIRHHNGCATACRALIKYFDI